MKQLTCEMCGSTDLLKDGGVFVCQTCGCKYSIEEARKMMVEGTVEVRGTVKIDNSDKIKNILQLAEDAFVDGRWDSAYGYSNEALAIRPDDPLAIALQGLSVLGKEEIGNDVPLSSTNAMKRMFTFIDADKQITAEEIDVVAKISKYIDLVCDAKRSGFIEEIRNFEYQKVEYSAGEETAAAGLLLMASLGGDKAQQNKAKADLDKIKARRLHNEALDAQISKVENRNSKVEYFRTSWKEQISNCIENYETQEKAKRIAAYWTEHAAEKAALDSEISSINSRLTDLESQLAAIADEVDPQIEALVEKKTVKIPEEIEYDKQNELVQELETTRSKLGLFKGKEKKAIAERLNTIEKPKLEELKKLYDVAKYEYLEAIDEEIEELEARGDDLRDEVEKLENRLEEINEELTKNR